MQESFYRYNYLLKISYNGKNFYGVVPQKNLRTVVGELVNILGIEKYRFSIVSRTDKGVSAEENYLVISTDKEIEIKSTEEIKILKVFKLKRFINIREFSRGKIYYYFLPENPNFFFKPKYLILDNKRIIINWKEGEFDLNKYIFGINKFVGRKSFHNFVKGRCNNCFCTIRKFDVFKKEGYYINVIEGDRFLYEMIRRIISFLVSVGKNVFPLEYIDLVFIGKLDPKPFPAPAENLLLKKVLLDWNKLYHYVEEIIL